MKNYFNNVSFKSYLVYTSGIISGLDVEYNFYKGPILSEGYLDLENEQSDSIDMEVGYRNYEL